MVMRTNAAAMLAGTDLATPGPPGASTVAIYGQGVVQRSNNPRCNQPERGNKAISLIRLRCRHFATFRILVVEFL